MRLSPAVLVVLTACSGFDGYAFHGRYAREGVAAVKLDCARLVSVDVRDERMSEQVTVHDAPARVVGERVQERTHRVRDRLAMIDVPGKWVRDGVESHLHSVGVATTGGHAQLVVGLLVLSETEEFAITANYFAHVSVGVKVLGPDGAVCYSSSFIGDGKNNGRQKSETNLAQTANRALDAALEDAFNSTALRKALCECAP